jgi:1,4-alpha-glucan branching enzyme
MKTKKDVGAILHKDYATFRVWAPFATSVALTGSFNDWGRTAMENEGDGYWFVKIPDAEAGQEYKFVIQNGERELFKNDPRALQVTTNDGNSVLVDTSFEWEDDGFTPPAAAEQVLYEMHVGTFNRTDPATTGTFASAAEKLDFLAELGVTTIELMPVCSMANDRGWGYAADYIYAVESLYGGHHGLLEFVQAAHRRGISVVLDVVYNHFGPDDKLDLWQFDGWSQDGKGGIYFYNDWRSSTPWGETRPDFGREEVRQYILDNVRMWLTECHLDGLRLDSTIYLRNVKGSNDDPPHDLPDGWSLLQRITELGRKINSNTLLIAEDIAYNDYIVKSTGEGGAGFTAQWEVTFPSVLRSALNAINDQDRNLGAICQALTHYYNGDAFQRIIYSDSHDSASNGGARLSEQISPGDPTSLFARRRSLLAASIVLTAPGVPMLFQGQEFLQGGSFNDWQELDWEHAEKFAGIVLAHKHLIGLRRNLSGNTRGLTGRSCSVVHFNDEDKVLAYHRWQDGGPHDDVIVVLNFANKSFQDYRLQFPRTDLWRVRFDSNWHGYSPDFKGGEAAEVVVENGMGSVSLAPYSVLILSQDD